MINLLKEVLSGHDSLIILGFGREGKSTYRLIRRWFPQFSITIADVNMAVAQDELITGDVNVEFSTGSEYLNVLGKKAVVFKSPGVSVNGTMIHPDSVFTSQTNLFIERFHQQIIGISGTKGKSTTSTLIHYLLENNGLNTVLLGNIGVPAFDKLDEISKDTWIVFELSAHQLQNVHHSPHIAVLLNVFPEHLDYFTSFEAYRDAKYNLFAFQTPDDLLIIEHELGKQIPQPIGAKLAFSMTDPISDVVMLGQDDFLFRGRQYSFPSLQLVGLHNRLNVLAAVMAVSQTGLEITAALSKLPDFRGLPHRLEFVGEKNGVTYYNDSISTIPASAMAAINALQHVGSIILGGFDRGLEYDDLVLFIEKSDVKCVVFVGKAGKRMQKLFTSEFKGDLYWADSFEQAVGLASDHTPKGSICLLSPAAASYDQFHNFEHRGDTFKELVFKTT